MDVQIDKQYAVPSDKPAKLTMRCSQFLNCGFGVIFHIHIDPNRPGQPEKPDEQNRDDNQQAYKCHVHRQVGQPEQGADKAKAEKSGDDVGDEHGTVVEPGAEEILLAAFGAGLRHVKGFVEGE